jgi:hypothetical protein
MNAKTFNRLSRKQAHSGLSSAAFCRTQGIAISTYHYCRKRFDASQARGGFVELRIGEAAPVPAVSPIRLEFRGATLILPEAFSVQSLRHCLEAVRESLPC